MMALSEYTSTGTSLDSAAQSEPPSSSTCAKSSDNFFTPVSNLGSTSASTEEDGSRPVASAPTPLYPLVHVNTKAEIEASKAHWTPSTAAMGEDLETDADRWELFQSLQKKWGDFFMDYSGQFKVGSKIAEGGQAEIFEVVSSMSSNKGSVVKLFKKGSSLRDLQKQWPQGMLQALASKHHRGPTFNHYSVNLFGALILEGRFAFWMQRYWGDLRTLIEIKMQKSQQEAAAADGQGCPIFTNSRVFHNILEIADGMRDLHSDGILHRDLKASNVLIRPFESKFDPISGYFLCKVSDYECSVGVVGTGFWRAPEILSRLHDGTDHSNLCTQKSDVYSYGMTCYEILTGNIPFADSLRSSYDFVCQGGRPELPTHIKPWIKVLLNKCWHQDPSKRPTFQEIIDYLCEHHKLDTHVQQT